MSKLYLIRDEPSDADMRGETPLEFWAKTTEDDQPGISVRDHCLNVGCVAEALIEVLPTLLKDLLPSGAATLAALHDVGKISTGFQSKCQVWLEQSGLAEAAMRERWRTHSESDHAKVTQYFLERAMKPFGTHLWAVAAGVHHGRIFGRKITEPECERISEREAWEKAEREKLLADLVAVFGALPVQAPRDSDLWCVAGLISVADWIGSNEDFFPSDRGLTLEQSREAAQRALDQIHWHGGAVRARNFNELFAGYSPMPLQAALHEHCQQAGLFIVEGPMGCGKTEAALWAAHRLIGAGANDGIYFALPTQVTSNRIHQRIAPFLQSALADAANLRLAHGASWLEGNQTMRLHPTDPNDPEAAAHVREGRSWFASSKHALLARFGVGTVDQALQGVVAVKHFFVRRFGLAGKVVILDEVHSYDVYTGTLITQLIRELLALRCSVIVLSATLTKARRHELILAAGGQAEAAQSLAYPLLTVVRAAAPVVEIPVEKPKPRALKLKTTALTEDEILLECIERAESGQHVLYLRNTVAEAQETCRKANGSVRTERVEVATLHSRFPFFRRQELENEWLVRLGKQRASDGKGSLLIATQVVEQSVDIDLDFIVSDLAPTDMLLQRMGRLWRHERKDRLATEPEFWINAPLANRDAGTRELKKAFGKSGYVYAPYVLLRTAEVFAGREMIVLPDQIREVLEATYAEREEGEEPEAWHELRAEVEAEREELAQEADAATRVLGRQSEDDRKEHLTRRKGAPTRDVVLVRACDMITRDQWHLTLLGGETLDVSGFEWSIAAARAVHRNLVRAPLHTVPYQTMPPWLKLHTHGPTFWALVQDDGTLHFPDAEGPSALAYDSMLGLHTRPGETQPRYTEDDDEFDS
jgi:CRISPR-associated endonuclease/helicase Cas3